MTSYYWLAFSFRMSNMPVFREHFEFTGPFYATLDTTLISAWWLSFPLIAIQTRIECWRWRKIVFFADSFVDPRFLPFLVSWATKAFSPSWSNSQRRSTWLKLKFYNLHNLKTFPSTISEAGSTTKRVLTIPKTLNLHQFHSEFSSKRSKSSSFVVLVTSEDLQKDTILPDLLSPT